MTEQMIHDICEVLGFGIFVFVVGWVIIRLNKD